MSVTLHTTHGPLKIEVLCDLVPKTAKNFLALCAAGAYNNTLFHRNIKGFIVQGGDPTNKGKGGVSIYGKYFDDEFSRRALHSGRGVVAMANRSRPNTNGSQFYITYKKQPHLDHKNSVFGRVIHGMDTLDKMEKVPVDSKYRPTEPIRVLKVTIHCNPIAVLDDDTDSKTTTAPPAKTTTALSSEHKKGENSGSVGQEGGESSSVGESKRNVEQGTAQPAMLSSKPSEPSSATEPAAD